MVASFQARNDGRGCEECGTLEGHKAPMTGVAEEQEERM